MEWRTVPFQTEDKVIQFELETDRVLFVDAFPFAQKQVRSLVERDPDYYPLHTEEGKWRHDKPVWTHWCDGFLPGMMWIFHRQIGPGQSRERLLV